MFEKFLENYFTEVEVSMVLDDDIPDAFSAWLVELEQDKMMELADEFAQEEVEKYISKYNNIIAGADFTEDLKALDNIKI